MTKRLKDDNGAEAVIELVDGVATVTSHGLVTRDLVMRSRQAIVEDPDFTVGMPTLYDIRAGSLSGLYAQAMRWIGDQGRKFKERRGAHRTALLVADDLSFGMSRMYEVLGGRPETAVRVFRDYDEALAWLRSISPAE